MTNAVHIVGHSKPCPTPMNESIIKFVFLLLASWLLQATVAQQLASAALPLISRVGFDRCATHSDRCVTLSKSTCLDISLPYKQALPGGLLNSSAALFPSSSSSSASFSFPQDEQDVFVYLNAWKGLQSVPRCWTSLQTLMCTLMLPRCDADRVLPPSYDLCRNVRTHCKVIDQYIE